MRQRFVGTLNWLLPGTGVKRWIVLAVFGLVLLLDAITRWFIAEGTGIHINEILDDIVDDYFPPVYLTGILGFLGIGTFNCGRLDVDALDRQYDARPPQRFSRRANRPQTAARLQDRRHRRRHGTLDTAARAQAPHQQLNGRRDGQRRRRLVGQAAERARRFAARRRAQLSRRAGRRRSDGDRPLPLSLHRRRGPERPLLRQSLFSGDERHHRQLRPRHQRVEPRAQYCRARSAGDAWRRAALRRARRRHDCRRRIKDLRDAPPHQARLLRPAGGIAARRSHCRDSRCRCHRARPGLTLHLGGTELSW